MPPFRPPKERIDSLAEQILAELSRHPSVQVTDPGRVRAAVRTVITDNLKKEHDLEEEVLRTLQAHGQQIYSANADFQKLFQDGKKILAKKKGFTL